MFNSYEYNPTQKVNINAVSGTLAKTCEKSFFKYAQIGSDLMDNLMGSLPETFPAHGSKKYEVVVLQAMCIGDSYMMFELMWKADFIELNKAKEQMGERNKI